MTARNTYAAVPAVLATALRATLAFAQTASQPADAPRPVGQPARVASFQPVADVRAFAVARAGDRAVLAYVGGDVGRARGAVRAAVLRGTPGTTGLERVGQDRTLAPVGATLAVQWDGTSGAVVYVVPRPHRGEPSHPGPHRHTPEETLAAVANPLGASALTASDVVLQRIDAAGAPVGRAVTVFEENSRTFRVAVARDGDGWLVAWTGAITSDGEVLGTVRSMRVDAAGTPRSAASDTGFTGQVGDALAIVPREGTRRAAALLWSGERCRAREGVAPYPPLEGDPSALIETRPRSLRSQQAPTEHPGPPVVCSPVSAFAAEVRPDGTTGPIIEGPALAADALALVREAAGGTAAVAPLGESVATGTLAAVPLDAQGRPGRARVVAAGTPNPPSTTARPPAAVATNPAATTTALPPASAPAAPSAVPPPRLPGASEIARAPAALDAAADATTLTFVALSPTRARAVYGVQSLTGGPVTLTLFAPAERTYGVAIAGAERGAPWLFAQTGGAWNGPLVFVHASDVAAREAPSEVPWVGDEVLRVHLLRATAARAEYTRLEGTYGPLSEREDAATNPNLPGIASMMHSRRMRWDAACGPLLERARFLSRRGAGADLYDLAREVCEIPVDVPAAGAAPVAPGAAAPAAP